MILRAIFILISSLLGWALFSNIMDLAEGGYLGLFAGFSTGAVVLLFEYQLKKVDIRTILGGFLGLLLGILSASLLSFLSGSIFNEDQFLYFPWRFFLLLSFGYLGLAFGIKAGKEFSPTEIRRMLNDTPAESNKKILDTSVIIDGRIADLCETGFLEGVFIVPQFILQELQHIADSSDSMKRARGRRGLDILHRVQKMADINVNIIDEDFPNIKDVDSKIVALGKKLDAKVITNDLNLNKVAELQGVRVLNINELCNALKPVVLPGESMRVFVLKEGKEAGQGIAYLDDGTMIVVDEARRLIGKNADVVVTSVLQTTAGRMIFSRLKEETESSILQSVR
ncbi:MAG: TRAM domain-containing protein [Nitrospirae bacterium]|nr:TRAM domain-containing protein [Nitrospirota bacterium]